MFLIFNANPISQYKQTWKAYRLLQESLKSTGHHEELEMFTEDLFKWSWVLIQQRSFGSRLSCATLIPFADCLNHANVAVKYCVKHNRDVNLDCAATNENKSCAEGVENRTFNNGRVHGIEGKLEKAPSDKLGTFRMFLTKGTQYEKVGFVVSCCAA